MLSFLRFYNQARRAGMAPLSRAGRGLVRRWERRAIAGYWTHAGYLNWDTGLGFERWHQAKKLGLAQQALIGIAQTRSLQPGSEWGRWAKWMLDRGLRFYERLPVGEGGLPDPVLFKLFTVPQSVGSARLAAARLEANAARALEAGLGHMRAPRRPPLYAFDPDIGRLAVTTPVYNTAIVAVNQRAFPYGGIELARLFDGDQRVAANVGGRAPAAFGLLVRQPDGRRVFSSQTARARTDPAVTPLRLTRAPSGTGATAATAPGGKVFAGPFKDLRARGTLTAGRFQAVTSHRFTPSTIETNWRLERRYGRARLRVDVLLPSWGARRPRRGGPARRLAPQPARAAPRCGSRASPASRSTSAHSGYTVVPLRRPRGRRRARAPALTPVVEPRSGADARDRDRAGRDVAASSLRRPDRRRSLAARRLREDQLAAPQRGSDLASLLDLRVRVADGVLDRLDVDAGNAHALLIPANGRSISPANTLHANVPSEIFAPGMLDGRVVLVTGGGTGLGRAAAAELRACGAEVVISGRRREVLEETAAELGAHSSRATSARARTPSAWSASRSSAAGASTCSSTTPAASTSCPPRRSSRRAGAPSRASTSAARS